METESTTNVIEYDTRNFAPNMLLNQIEKSLNQTINLTDSERQDPNNFIAFLDKLKKVYNLELDKGSSPNFFKPSQQNKSDFENILSNDSKQPIDEVTTKLCIYLIFLNRKSMAYTFNNEVYNFNVKDVYEIKNIGLSCFVSPYDIPVGIVKRSKLSYEKNQTFVKKVVKKMNKISSIYKKNAEVVDDPSSDEESINKAKNTIYKLSLDIDDMAIETYQELQKIERTEPATIEDVINMITTFSQVAIKLNEHDMTSQKVYEDENGFKRTNNKEIIKTLGIDDVYIQNSNSKTWDPVAKHIIQLCNSLAPINLQEKALKDVCSKLEGSIQKLDTINVFSIPKNIIFAKNCNIVLDITDKSINYEVFPLSYEVGNQKLMFDQATDSRIDLVFNEKVSTTFKDNPHNINVTPDFIFGHLAKRGFEVEPDDTEEEKRTKEDEIQSRANLLMMYLLKALTPRNTFENFKGTWLHLMNAGNSGKSTYMSLISNMIGPSLSKPLEVTDFDLDNEFGIIHVKDMYFINVDEATDGNKKIATEKLKKIATGDKLTGRNLYDSKTQFKPFSTVILASNSEPNYVDKSEGVERRLLTFDLKKGLDFNKRTGKDISYSFIKEDLIERHDFQSAALLWCLENARPSWFIPESVSNRTKELLLNEDDVQTFINESIREVIKEPLIISKNDLYEMYKLENISKDRGPSQMRNSSNFYTAILKMSNVVFHDDRPLYSEIDTLNHTIAVEHALFSRINSLQNNNRLGNAFIKHQMTLKSKRDKALKEIYEKIEHDLSSITSKNLETSRSKMLVIIPKSPIYTEANITQKQVKSIINGTKLKISNGLLHKDVIANIKNRTYNRVPTAFNKEGENLTLDTIYDFPV